MLHASQSLLVVVVYRTFLQSNSPLLDDLKSDIWCSRLCLWSFSWDLKSFQYYFVFLNNKTLHWDHNKIYEIESIILRLTPEIYKEQGVQPWNNALPLYKVQQKYIVVCGQRQEGSPLKNSGFTTEILQVGF